MNGGSAALHRVDGLDKACGRARYTDDVLLPDAVYLCGVQATVPRGRVVTLDVTGAATAPGVLAVVDHRDPPVRWDGEPHLRVLQSDEVHYRGQYVAAVVATSREAARAAADLVEVGCAQDAAIVDLATADPATAYEPATVIPDYPARSAVGDVTRAMAVSRWTVEETYRTPLMHNNPMEPHTCAVRWEPAAGGRAAELLVHDSTQSVWLVHRTLVSLLGLPDAAVQVVSEHVGGGFGAKGAVHPNLLLAVVAAFALPGRTVRHTLPRQQMFDVVGFRTPTVQKVRLDADEDGYLLGVQHAVTEETSRVAEFGEQCAVYSRRMYAAPHRLTTHHLVPLDVGVPTFMRAPGEAPGSFAAEVALDELARRMGVDPVELRLRNEPAVDPESGLPFSSRGLAQCLRVGAERFGWARRGAEPRHLLEDGWWRGVGVAGCSYPDHARPGSRAAVCWSRGPGGAGRAVVSIGAADLGQGARTVLTQIAAEALAVPVADVTVELGSTRLPWAVLAGGSRGTGSWGAAVVDACRRLRAEHGEDPPDGAEAHGEALAGAALRDHSVAGYGAQFAEVAVNARTGEPRVRRMLGVFGVGRVINPRLVTSQLVGGMIWGLSMALHEESVRDPRTGGVVTRDLASYHVATHADVPDGPDILAEWIDERDPVVNVLGAKGVGEIGIVGAAAAIANAVHHATGVRVRRLPITVDAFLG